MSTLTVNTVDSKKFQMNETTSDNVTIPSTKSALILYDSPFFPIPTGAITGIIF